MNDKRVLDPRREGTGGQKPSGFVLGAGPEHRDRTAHGAAGTEEPQEAGGRASRWARTDFCNRSMLQTSSGHPSRLRANKFNLLNYSSLGQGQMKSQKLTLQVLIFFHKF